MIAGSLVPGDRDRPTVGGNGVSWVDFANAARDHAVPLPTSHEAVANRRLGPDRTFAAAAGACQGMPGQ